MQVKAVFHIDEKIKWRLVINNIKNLLSDLDEYQVLVVANADAVREYIQDESVFSQELAELTQHRVRLCACRNALNGHQIKEEDIFAFVDIVPVGIKEIVQKQLEGYAYIKP